MKKLLSLLIALIVVLSTVASCAAPADSNRDTAEANDAAGDLVDDENGAPSDDGNEPEDYETDDSETIAEETETETESLPDTETDVPPHEDAFVIEDLDGYEFSIMSYTPISNNMASCSNDFDEPSEEIYANAVYQRNLEVEHLFGITISETVFDNASSVFNTLKDDTYAGADFYDLCFMSTYNALPMAAASFVKDVDTFENIDLEKSWWNKDCIDQLAVHGNHSIISGDISVTDKEALWAVYFNKDLISSLGLENPYELVTSGEWTRDKMYEMSVAAFSANKNTAGLVTTNEHIVAGWASAGQKLVSLDEAGKASLSCGNDTFYGILTELKSMMDDDSVLVVFGSDSEGISSSLASDRLNEGTALFSANPIYTVGSMRAEDTPFGILPMPKYSTSSADYVSHVSFYFSTIAVIPATVYYDAYEVGLIVEALAAKGAEIITPAYYDILLTSASGRDEESASMLDIIFANRSYDIGALCNFNSLCHAFKSESDLSPSQIYKSRKKDIEETLKESW